MNILKDKKSMLVLKAIFGVGIVYLLFRSIDLGKFIESVENINFLWLFLAGSTYFCLTLGISYRFREGLKTIGKKINFFKVYLANMFGMLLSEFTPGRVGYGALVYDLKKRADVRISESFAIVGTLGAIDLFVKGIYALIGLAFITFMFRDVVFMKVAIIASLGVISVGLIFLMIMWFNIKIFEKMIYSMPFVGKWMMEIFDKIKDSSKILKSKLLFFLLLTFVFWVMRGIEWYFLGRATGVNLPFLTLFMLQPLLTAVRYLPITPSGLGFYEGAIVLGLSIFGIPAENALLFSFMDRFDNGIVNLIGISGLRSRKSDK